MSREKIQDCVVRFIKEEDGATAIEYGLFASLIALLIIAGVSTIGTTLQATFVDIGNCLADPTMC